MARVFEQILIQLILEIPEKGKRKNMELHLMSLFMSTYTVTVSVHYMSRSQITVLSGMTLNELTDPEKSGEN